MPLRLPSVTLLAAACFASGMPSHAHAQSSDKDHKDDYDLRFYCPAFNTRPKYVQGRNGGLIYVDPSFEDIPPSIIYVKKDGKDDLQIPLQANAFGQRVTFPSKAAKAGRLELLAGKISWVAGKAPNSGMGASIEKLPFINLDIAPGQPTLVCLYQPSLKAKWMPPKQLVVDLSPKKFPAGSALVLNLTGTPVAYALGEGAKVAELPAGESIVATPSKHAANGSVPLKVASKTKAGYVVLSNGERELPAGRRAAIVITSVDPSANAGLTENVDWQLLVEDEPAKEKSAASR